MTFAGKDEEEGVEVIPAPLLGLEREEDLKGNYVKLGGDELEKEEKNGFFGGGGCNCMGASSSGLGYEGKSSSRCWSLWWWAKLVLLLIFVGVLAVVFLKWVGPFFMDKVNFSLTFVLFRKYLPIRIMYLFVLFVACEKVILFIASGEYLRVIILF